MKVFLLLPILLLPLMLQTSSCHRQEDAPIVKWKGNDDVNDLVFVFKKGITREQKETFQRDVLYRPRPDGRGQDHQDGVEDMMIGTIKGDHVGGIINFSKTATIEQREKLKKTIESSSIVLKVYVNVVPNEITDLPGDKKMDANGVPDTGPRSWGHL